VGTLKSFHKRSRAEKFEYRTEARTEHLLERISRIENLIYQLHKAKCPCGSTETVNTGEDYWILFDRALYPKREYHWGEMRCFYCHKLLEAYGVRG